MMYLKMISYIFFLFATFSCDKANAQLVTQSKIAGVSIGSVAIMDIEPQGDISLEITAPQEAGASYANPAAADQSKWINYSCSDLGVSSRRIDIAIVSGSVPPGFILKATAGAYTGNGDGILGHSAGTVNLSLTPQTIIDNIVRGYTGNGSGNGHQISFEVVTDDFADIHITSGSSVTIQYTLTDN